MASSESAPNEHAWSGESQRAAADDRNGTCMLEVGMSGMSLVSGLVNMESGKASTSASITDGVELPPEGSRGSASSSPVITSSKGVNKPPGLGGPIPSPITKPTHRKNNSSNSPSLTLTPNSSVDGNSDWNSLGNRPSPYRQGEAPNMPYLTADGRRQDEHPSTASFGVPGEDDGLRGLEALRERAHSSPGPLSQSPPVLKNTFSGHIAAVQGARGQNRPPRSTVLNEGSVGGDRSVGERSLGDRSIGSSGNYTGDNRSVGDRSIGSLGHASFPSTNRSNEVSSHSVDSTDVLGLGAIARPELRLGANEYDPSRRRSASSDNFQSYHNSTQPGGYSYDNQGASQQTFGSLPSLNVHLQQQQRVAQYPGPQSFGDVQKPRHVRSVSQPGFGHQSGAHHQGPLPNDPRYYNGQMQDDSYSKMQRSQSVSYGGYGGYDNGAHGQYQKRSSLPTVPNAHGGYPPIQRRESLDFIAGGQQMPDDGRSFGPSVISPGQSPHQMHYGHNRVGYSDNSMTTSPMSLGSNAMRSQSSHHNSSHHHDEDLTHPLVGEHIEVPSDQFGGGQVGGGYQQQHRGNNMRQPHGRSLSVDPAPNQYMDRHLPANNAALPTPKVVYNIKFKRSQRNFVLGPRISRDLKIGTYVKVEADRGEDLGIVVGKAPAEKYNYPSRSSFSAGMGPPGGSSVAELKRIVRLATHDEVSLLNLKREEEEELLSICRTKVRQRGLPMHVVDAEYQFDRHKLTFFFEAEGRVDFRELVRDLFSMYKTRIWMQQLDKTTSTSSPAMMGPPEQGLQMDFGTPIIAPTSEFADSIMLHGYPGTEGGPY